MSRASAFEFTEEAAPLLQGFAVVSTLVEPIRVGDRCRATHKSVVRKSVKTNSERLGQLERGAWVTVLEAVTTQGGQRRLKGWFYEIQQMQLAATEPAEPTQH